MRRVGGVLVLLVAVVSAGVAAASPQHRRPDVPPPTPVPPYTSPSPFPTVLATPRPALHAPKIDAAAAILEDLDTGQVLFAVHPDDRRALASTTKIMTALVVLERAKPDDVVTVSAAAGEEGGAGAGFSELGLHEGEHLTVRHLLYALMLQSANDAAVALADHVSGKTGRFVALMNREAREEGFGRTRFYSPNGLDDRGFSTARSLAAMTRDAEREPVFARVVETKFHIVPAPAGDKARHIQNRNVLLWLYPGAVGVKTGFTTKAGYCLVAAARRHGAGLVAVVLGEPTGENSFSDAAALLDYGFHAFARDTVIEDGQVAPPVTVGDAPVPVEAGRALEAWIPAETTEEPKLAVHLKTVEPPVEDGDRVGTWQATLGGLVLGTVPLEVTQAPPEDVQLEGSPNAPWWQRGIDTVNDVVNDVFHTVFG